MCLQGRATWVGVGGGVSPPKKSKKGAQLAERGPWKAGIAKRVKY